MNRSSMNAGSALSAELSTYASWSHWFEQFADGGDDDALLARAAGSTFALTANTADNFARRAAETLSGRLDGVGIMLRTGLRQVRNENDAVLAILNARGAFLLLRRYADLPCWPETLRSQLGELVDHHMSERQQHLLKSAAADRSGRLATAIRNNPLDRAGLVSRRPVEEGIENTHPSEPRPRRPILF